MTVAAKKFTLDEYLAYDDGTGAKYELLNGELLRMAVGTGEHGAISEFLNDEFKAEITRSHLPWTAKDMKIGVQSPRGNRWDSSRIPDVVVLPQSQWVELRNREAVIRLNAPPPLLVVEVVSPSTIAADYRAKHSEYAVLNISEYWIVDPLKCCVTVCLLEDGAYTDRLFTADTAIISTTFPNLSLSANQILQQ